MVLNSLIDDDDIETTIHVKFSASPPAESAVADPFSVETPLCESEATGTGADEYLDHGRTSDGSTAACALETSHGVISCVSCVAASFSKFVAGLNESDLGVAEYVLKCIRASGSSGMTKAMLLQYDAEPERVLDLVQRMASLVPPVLVWTGYVIPVVVASEHTASWTVVVSEEPTTLVLPRRWLDVRGLKLDEFWTAALRAIVSTVVLHPGIPQAELRWRLKAVYDRQEFLEAVTFLEQDGMLEARVNDSEALLKRIKMIQGWAATLDDEEEKRVYWFIGNNKRWYRV
ncbi:hypothetical protein ID866_10612 [Astraeus odoratus]|nr:hypothetical protein ID866_10612 [Astraeus odoratus]